MAETQFKDIKTAVFASLAEWLFAMLPLVVVAIVMGHLGRFHDLPESPEWSFGAAVLAAQALARFIGGVARARQISWNRVLFGIAGILVFLVVPANVVMAIVLLGELRGDHASFGLGVAQVLLFAAASVVFVILATAGHLWAHHRTDQIGGAPRKSG